jgi:hypothetical protein
MLYLFTGTDRKKANAAMHAAIRKILPKAEVVRITDANSLADLEVALRGRGMFDPERALVLDNVFANDEMRSLVEVSLTRLSELDEHIFLIEEKVDAATRKSIEKFAELSQKFDAAKEEKEDNFFAIANAFRAGKKKELWVLLQREYATGKAPEMLHGTLFWAAKQMVLKPRGASDAARGKKLVALLAELPHEARRRGEELEYALERFVLSGT